MKFKTKAAEEKRSVRLPIRLTTAERAQIEESAVARDLEVTEYVRRAALGRKTDIRYERKIILEIRELVKAFRDMHAHYASLGVVPPEAELRMLMDVAAEAMLRYAR